MIKILRANYLDASALVKLVAEDADETLGRDALRAYYRENAALVYATSFSVAEALSAFKAKSLRKRITEAQYLKYLREFLRLTVGTSLRIDELPLLSPVVLKEAERMVPIYGIDFLDCIQISTIKHGQFRHMASNSSSLLITADRGLAKAARAESVTVWLCIEEAAPVVDVPEVVRSMTAGL